MTHIVEVFHVFLTTPCFIESHMKHEANVHE
jgi:hypothetical protein